MTTDSQSESKPLPTSDYSEGLATEIQELRQQVKKLAHIVGDLLQADADRLSATALREDRKTLEDILRELGK